MPKRLTTEQFKFQMQQKNPNIKILGEYFGDKVKIECECKICGNKWEDSPTHLKEGRGCTNCKKQNQLEVIKQDYIKRVSEIHNYKYDYSKINYVNQHSKIKIICPIHGEFLQEAQSHLIGRGCPTMCYTSF